MSTATSPSAPTRRTTREALGFISDFRCRLPFCIHFDYGCVFGDVRFFFSLDGKLCDSIEPFAFIFIAGTYINLFAVDSVDR